jgi:hypothetical protein
VGLASTAESINIAGTLGLHFYSTGAGTTGEADLALPGGSVTVKGRVYQQAVADVSPLTVDFGIVHVGESVATRSVQVGNTADVAALNDLLQAGWTSDSTGVFGTQGDLGAGLAAGMVDSSSLSVALDTSAAGIYIDSALLEFQSVNPELADLFLGLTEIGFQAQVNNFANPIFTLDTGPASLSIGGLDFVLDFGTLFSDVGGVNAGLGFINAVEGPADLLRGGYDTTGISRFLLDGFLSFDNLGAGGIISDLHIGFDTFDLGVGSFQETVLLAGLGFNASGYEQRFDITLGIHAQIRDRGAVSVNEPPTLLALLAGLLGLLGARWLGARRAASRW